MKTLKITKRIFDKEEKRFLQKDDVIERSNERAKDFAKYSEDITPEEPKKKKKSKKE